MNLPNDNWLYITTTANTTTIVAAIDVTDFVVDYRCPVWIGLRMSCLNCVYYNNNNNNNNNNYYYYYYHYYSIITYEHVHVQTTHRNTCMYMYIYMKAYTHSFEHTTNSNYIIKIDTNMRGEEKSRQ